MGRPVPGLIRLGSLSDICRRLDLPDSGKNIGDIKRALHQNASAYITAKVRYKTRDGAERWIEIGTTRYTVVMTGETLPDGRRADAVYLLLHDFYRQILDSAATRPLDYGYLRKLPPGLKSRGFPAQGFDWTDPSIPLSSSGSVTATTCSSPFGPEVLETPQCVSQRRRFYEGDVWVLQPWNRRCQ